MMKMKLNTNPFDHRFDLLFLNIYIYIYWIYIYIYMYVLDPVDVHKKMRLVNQVCIIKI